MGKRMDNLSKAANNPQQRNIFLIIGATVFIALGAGFYFASKSKVSNTPSGANVAPVPNVTAIPGQSTSPEYNKKVDEQNQKQADNALDTGKTYVPTISGAGNINTASPLDLLEQQKADQAKKQQEEADRLAEQARQKAEQDRLAQQQTPPVVQQPVIVQQVVAPAPVKKPKYTSDDYILLNALIANQAPKLPSSEFNYAGQKLDDKTTGSASAQPVLAQQQAVSQGQTQNNMTATQAPLLKSGEILNAVLETAVNSDEPGPVLAKVVSGPLKGTRLIGSMQNVGEKVVLQFSTANMPNQSTSIKMSGVAVDPDTTRTALASDVNHHYFLRYGVMLGAAFLQGWSNAIGRQNTTVSTSPFGGTTVTQGDLTSGQINKQALGQVGQQLANNVTQDTQNMKPTVKVDSGIAIGILMMEDLVIKQN